MWSFLTEKLLCHTNLEMIFESFLPDLKVRSKIQQERCRRRFVEKLQLSKRRPKFLQFRDRDLKQKFEILINFIKKFIVNRTSNDHHCEVQC